MTQMITANKTHSSSLLDKERRKKQSFLCPALAVAGEAIHGEGGIHITSLSVVLNGGSLEDGRLLNDQIKSYQMGIGCKQLRWSC